MSTEYTKADKFVVIVSSIVAVTALIVSVWQGIEMRKHNRLSVKPLFSFTRNFNTVQNVLGTDTTVVKTYQLKVSNYGTGPGIIEHFKLFYNDEEIVSEKSSSLWIRLSDQLVEKKIIDSAINFKQISGFDSGDVIVESGSNSVIQCDLPGEAFRNVRVEFKYKSIYDESFIISTKLQE